MTNTFFASWAEETRRWLTEPEAKTEVEMAINSRMKGKTGELELAELLREHGFSGAARGVQYKGGPDSPDVIGVPGCHIECKRVEALQLYAALEQAQKDAGPGDTPLVAHRKNRKPWVAILHLDDYLLMVRELETLRKHAEHMAEAAYRRDFEALAPKGL